MLTLSDLDFISSVLRGHVRNTDALLEAMRAQGNDTESVEHYRTNLQVLIGRVGHEYRQAAVAHVEPRPVRESDMPGSLRAILPR